MFWEKNIHLIQPIISQEYAFINRCLPHFCSRNYKKKEWKGKTQTNTDGQEEWVQTKARQDETEEIWKREVVGQRHREIKKWKKNMNKCEWRGKGKGKGCELNLRNW